MKRPLLPPPVHIYIYSIQPHSDPEKDHIFLNILTLAIPATELNEFEEQK